MWFVYILQCQDKTLYTGITTDVARRLREHNRGKGGHYTRVRVPAQVVMTESYPDRSSASKREAGIKALSRLEKIALIKRQPSGKIIKARP